MKRFTLDMRDIHRSMKQNPASTKLLIPITREPHHIPRTKEPAIPDVETTVVRQVIPNVVLEKLKPTIQLPADLTEPPTPLAKVLVILTNHDGRDNGWTGQKIKKLIRDHAWQDDGADEAIE